VLRPRDVLRWWPVRLVGSASTQG